MTVHDDDIEVGMPATIVFRMDGAHLSYTRKLPATVTEVVRADDGKVTVIGTRNEADHGRRITDDSVQRMLIPKAAGPDAWVTTPSATHETSRGTYRERWDEKDLAGDDPFFRRTPDGFVCPHHTTRNEVMQLELGARDTVVGHAGLDNRIDLDLNPFMIG